MRMRIRQIIFYLYSILLRDSFLIMDITLGGFNYY